MKLGTWAHRKRAKSGTALTTKERNARYRRNSPEKVKACRARAYAKMMADPVRKERMLVRIRAYNKRNAVAKAIKRRELRHRRKAEKLARGAALLAWR